MAKPRETRRINLALQGGGAHGAFTWGVIERLLDEDWLEIAAISGTSAGALNGAAVKAGLMQAKGKAGRDAVRENLEWLWNRVAETSDLRMGHWPETWLGFMPEPMQRWFGLFSPMSWMDAMSRLFSPYDYGTFWGNPLQPLIEDLPYAQICADCPPYFCVSATNVRTGKIRVFSGREITVNAILASACLPTLFRAVEIDDPATGRREAYWDGGYSGNPALFPLFDQSFPQDIIVVGINPLVRDAVPRTPAQIEDRINEISFNSSLLGEMRAIAFVRELIAEGRLQNRQMKDVLLHMIVDDGLMGSLSVETKMMPDRSLLTRLRAAGQKAADAWLEENADNIGRRPSVDFDALLG